MNRIARLLFILPGLLFLLCVGLAAPASQAQTPEAPLKLSQIEQLLEIKFEDNLLAREIQRRGLAFRVDRPTLEQLQRRGLGEQARQALLQQAERQTYAAFRAEPEPAKRLALGREFLRSHPRSEYLPKVQAELHGLAVEVFRTNVEAFVTAPDAPKLNQLLETGQALLEEHDDPASVLLVKTYLAVATAKGTLGNFFQDLERSQALASTAIQLLEETAPAGALASLRQDLREQYLPELWRAQALYLLRQANAEPEQALDLLDRAIRAGQMAVAKEAITYWLRALARVGSSQNQAQALSSANLSATDRQALCARLTGSREKLVDDYTRVVALSATAKGRSLHDEANVALKKLLNSPRPCAEAAEIGEVKSPPAASRRARKVRPEEPKLRTVFILSKTVYLKANLLEAALLKQPDFQRGGWRIVRNQKEADVVVELNLPFLSWNWTFEVSQPATATLLATDKVHEALANQAAARLAEKLNEVFKRLREQ